jgi:hypothetical protein
MLYQRGITIKYKPYLTDIVYSVCDPKNLEPRVASIIDPLKAKRTAVKQVADARGRLFSNDRLANLRKARTTYPAQLAPRPELTPPPRFAPQPASVPQPDSLLQFQTEAAYRPNFGPIDPMSPPSFKAGCNVC